MTAPVRDLTSTQQAGRDFSMRGLEGEIVLLNLLNFRDMAGYSANPELAPATPISGAEAFNCYIQHTLPFLRDSGGELRLLGRSTSWLIGHESERWDVVVLVRQRSAQSFMAFAHYEASLAGIWHRTAAIEDSRLLPLSDLTLEESAT